MHHLPLVNLLSLAQIEVETTGGGGGGWFAGGCMIAWLLLLLALLAVVIWAIVDAVNNPNLDSTMKLVWILVILFVPFGFLIYFLVANRAR